MLNSVPLSTAEHLLLDKRPLDGILVFTSTPGATLSQLWDSGQTLSEDSGVDIAEAGGVSKDGSPRPSKSQPGAAPGERPGNQGPPVHTPGTLHAPTQVRLEEG